ncbi:uncharacterized protein Pyn_27221 [Prunus yedoensis var. nudiflora]|uniref:Uncharacterized protein n=1 Tax=Prunus yedoensis var. nudiflora TaxID=2094558 RepID=A0A314XUZ3_PRUYE|nr:uncharacterized protein Pyn_27221 [Prunus yedoensis var. nudiflora]
MHEEEQLHDDEKTGSDALQQAGEVLGQSAQSAMDVEKQPDLAAPKTMWDSLDSASRNNATVLHELSAARIERVETHASRLHKDAFEFLEVGDSCKDDDKVWN